MKVESGSKHNGEHVNNNFESAGDDQKHASMAGNSKTRTWRTIFGMHKRAAAGVKGAGQAPPIIKNGSSAGPIAESSENEADKAEKLRSLRARTARFVATATKEAADAAAHAAEAAVAAAKAAAELRATADEAAVVALQMQELEYEECNEQSGYEQTPPHTMIWKVRTLNLLGWTVRHFES